MIGIPGYPKKPVCRLGIGKRAIAAHLCERGTRPKESNDAGAGMNPSLEVDLLSVHIDEDY